MKSRFVVAFMLPSAVFLSAQTFRGGIQGTVTDSTGASVPGAQVTVTNVGTGLSRTGQTDTLGNYSFTELGAGSPFRMITDFGAAPPLSLALLERQGWE